MYEYLTINMNKIEDLSKLLNDKAKDGWILDSTINQVMILRRGKKTNKRPGRPKKFKNEVLK